VRKTRRTGQITFPEKGGVLGGSGGTARLKSSNAKERCKHTKNFIRLWWNLTLITQVSGTGLKYSPIPVENKSGAKKITGTSKSHLTNNPNGDA